MEDKKYSNNDSIKNIIQKDIPYKLIIDGTKNVKTYNMKYWNDIVLVELGSVVNVKLLN